MKNRKTNMSNIPFEEIPHYVQIETSYNCNARCSFCYNPCRNKPTDYDKLRKVVHQVAKAKIPHVQLTGGEVSLLPFEYLNRIIDELSKTSSVTIQTNGIIYIKNLTKNLAAIYLSLHGTKKYHDKLQQVGKWEQIVRNIKRYIVDGFEVNLDFTLTSQNYSNFEEISLLAENWGVYQYSINKFEPAGQGVANFQELAPSVEQFKNIIDQIIRLQSKTKLHIGFCTAVPFCLDPRLPEYGLLANCGAGTSFLAVSPDGEVRICNQSNTSYGNILKRKLVDIWKDKALNEFRDKSWVIPPCRNCFIFDECLGGCKVDNSQKGKYCIDHAVRNYTKAPISKKQWQRSFEKFKKSQKYLVNNIKLQQKGIIHPDKFSKLNLAHQDKFLITRHQTVKVDPMSIPLLTEILREDNSIDDILRIARKKSFSIASTKRMLKALLRAKAVFLQPYE